ncbi:hypothetical protein RB653_007758 [Dictyostelium firmibasis]|uniref:EGF-like domain-containing protein n=1 Tax=Dictyostelium firmibasis TaxID=79012 RepID=A0AAN7TP84_9MYCE
MRKLTLLIFIHLFYSFVFCDIPLTQKNTIDYLKNLYSVPPFENCALPGCDYCSQPLYFLCNEMNLTIIQINLIGNGLNKIDFPESWLFNFDSLIKISLENSIISNQFFQKYPSKNIKLKLNNCVLYQFPPNLYDFTSVTMNDITFDGDIDISYISNLENFEFTYSKSFPMRNYTFTNIFNRITRIPKINITLNNFVNTTIVSDDCTFYLGKFYDDSTNIFISQINCLKFTIIDSHYNSEVKIPTLNSFVVILQFYNINFKLEDNKYFNFSPMSYLMSITFENCNGLIDILNNLRIIVSMDRKYEALKILNCGLTILPSTLFFENFYTISFANNNITGSLPNILEPIDGQKYLTIDLSNNQLSGPIPENYCFHIIDFSFNKLVADLPMCFLCDYSTIEKYIIGNNFTNIVNGIIPKCSGIKYTSKAIFIYYFQSFVSGINLGWPNSLNKILSYPAVELLFVVPNKQLKVLFPSTLTADTLKNNNFSINTRYNFSSTNVSLQVEISPPIVSYILEGPQSNSSITNFEIVGKAFQSSSQFEGVAIYFDNINCKDIKYIPSTLSCTIHSFIKDKIYNVTVRSLSTNLTSEVFRFTFIRTFPTIFEIISPKREGGLVQFKGYYGSFIDYPTLEIGKNPYNVSFFNSTLITSTIGPDISFLNYKISFDSSSNITGIFHYSDDPKYCNFCNEINGGGICNTTIGKCECSNQYQGQTCSIVSQYVSSIIPSSSEGGLATFFGWFGYNSSEYPQVLIGNKNCPLISFNDSVIICQAPPGIGTYDITVNQNSVNYTLKNSYQYYLLNKECPNDCTSKTNGQCNKTTGFCHCFINWYGFDCSIYQNQSPNSPSTNTSIDYNSGNANVTNQETIFQISIYLLLEVDINGQTVKEYKLNNNWVINNNNNNNNNNNSSNNSNDLIYTFVQSIQNNGSCNITYRIEEIKELKNISFAGIDYSVEGGSIKTTISIENYKYSSNLNTLQLQFKSLATTNENNEDYDNECNENETTINENQQQGYITIKKNAKMLMGRFLNRIISDGRSTFISTSVISKDNDSIVVAMNLPHCLNCFIDPDYSVLISPEFKSSCEDTENKKRWLIPVVVVIPIVSISLIVALSYILYRKNIKKAFLRKLKMIDLSNKY